MYEQDFKSSLRDLVTRVQKESYEWSWSDLSKASDLSTGTCRNLTLGKTRSPHYRTVLKIAKAIGVDIAFEQTEEPARPQLKIAKVTRAARKKTRRLKKTA